MSKLIPDLKVITTKNTPITNNNNNERRFFAQQPPIAITKNSPLQGYLLKHSSSRGHGVVVASFRKKRWFRFSPTNCTLYYYRTSEDLFPLGEIGIESASFTIKPSKSFFIFEIISANTGKVLCLEASSASDGFRWVKNLQLFRHQFYQNKYLDGIHNNNNENNKQRQQKSPNTKVQSESKLLQSNNITTNKYSDAQLLKLVECSGDSGSCNQPPPETDQLKPQPDFDDNFSTEQWIDCDSGTEPTAATTLTITELDESTFFCAQDEPIVCSITSNTGHSLTDNLQSIPNMDLYRSTESTTQNHNNSLHNHPHILPSSASIPHDIANYNPNSATTKNKLLKSNSTASDSHKHNTMTTTAVASSSSSSSSSATNQSYQPKSSSKSSILFGGFVSRIRTAAPTNNSAEMPNHPNHSSCNSDCCAGCRELEQKLTTLSHDKFALEDEVKTNREVIKILQEQLRIFNSENHVEDLKQSNKTSDKETGSGASDQLTMEQNLIKYKLRCNQMEKEMQILSEDKRNLENSKLVLEEMLESRDRSLVSLTHEVYDLESKHSRMQTRAELEREFLQDEMPRKMQQRMEQLEDTVVAFEHQNEFLNKEIIELNEIKNILELKVKASQSKLCEVEAKCSQIQSKLLSLLKELNQSFQDNERAKEEEFHGNVDHSAKSASFVNNETIKLLVNRLLEESSLDIPLSWKPGNRPRNWSNSENVVQQQKQEYDELGFYMAPSSIPHDLRSYDLVLEPDKNETAWRSKWDQFVNNFVNQEFVIGNLELKHMLRLGVPQDYRCKIWRMLIHKRVKSLKTRLGPDYYDSLVRTKFMANQVHGTSKNNKVIDPSAKQIELDLLRTLPNNRHFENLESDGIGRLRRVLVAYSHHNRSVGYCQGLNRLAAVALLFMPEEDAFWCLVSIVETIMPNDYFGRNLMGAHVDQYVLRDLISEKLPQLSQHMEEYQIEISLFAWFLTVFVDNIPVSVYLHIWDVFLHEGSKVLFRFALAILRIHEAELLQLNDSASVNQFLRTLDERQFNLQRLSDIAFRELNPFSSRSVRMKRTHYTALVNDELKKIEEFRDTMKQQNATAAAEREMANQSFDDDIESE